MTNLRELIDGAIRTNMLMGLQDAELFDEPGLERINDWADWISENAAKAVQPELDRLRAELDRARALANLRPCAYSGPHPCHLQGDGRSLYHCPGVLAPQE